MTDLPHTSPKVLSAADLKRYRESGSRIAQTEQFLRLIATIDALTAERDAALKEVEALREALQMIVACAGGQWDVVRYERERQELLDIARALLERR